MANFGTIIALLCLAGYASASQVDATSLQTIATEAYLYFYPIVTMDVTRRQSALSGNQENTFTHIRTFPNVTNVVRTNFDTLYSTAWLDLTDGPILMSLPDTAGRYFVMPIIDMWTDVVAAPGWRTTGTDAVEIAILPPGCSGCSGNSKYKTVEVSTPYSWIIGRTQTNGVNDYAAVNAIQSKYKLKKLKGYKCPDVDAPKLPDSIKSINMTSAKTILLVNGLTAQQFFEYSAYLLSLNRPHITDWSQVEMFQKIGITPGKPFKWSSQSSDVQAALQNGSTAGIAAIKAQATQSTLVNGWNMNLGTVGVYGNSYLMRAYITAIGLGANQPQDAVYPMLVKDANGAFLDGKNCYRITFPKGQTPPTQAYWSLTMYDSLGFQIPNPISRYALHSWDDQYGMTYSAVDQSLTIYIQAQQPKDNSLVGNWLPSSANGTLSISMRIYAPLDSVVTYKPPAAIPSACV